MGDVHRSRRLRLGLLAALTLIAGAAAIAVPLIASGSSSSSSPSRPPTIYDQAKALDLHPIAGNFEPNGTKLADCSSTDVGCFEQAFGNLAYHDGPKATLALFRTDMVKINIVGSDCHRIAHTIGSASLARFHGNVAEAFARGDSTCWSGYYHGILERSFAGASTPARFNAIARTVCDEPSLQHDLFLLYQCVHGLGHGLMIQSGYNLPFSLTVCDHLQTAWDQTSCTGGVFMENFAAGVTSAYGVKSPYLKDNDLVYPCDAVKERHKLYCYLMITSRILQANGYNWKQTAAICDKVESGWVDECFQSFGRDADGYSRQNVPQVLSLCTLAGKWQNECVYGASRDLTSQDSGTARSPALCDAAPAGLRSYCFFGIGTILGTLKADAVGREQACRSISIQYAAVCTRGANGRPF
jgi:hypothetical protein